MKNISIILVLILLVFIACQKTTNGKKVSGDMVDQIKPVREISSTEEFTKIMESSGSRLLMFDLYADWCVPCKKLSPLLAEVQHENLSKVDIFKINTDKLPEIAQAFRVSAIPYVVYVKEKKGVYALTGLQSKEAYIEIINRFADIETDVRMEPMGIIKDGIREIQLDAGFELGDIYVHRGETIRLNLGKVDYDHIVKIPEFNIEMAAPKGQPLSVKFKASNTGVFPILCEGDCPDESGNKRGRIIVMAYEGSEEGKFEDISPEKAKALLDEGIFVLDVRTKREYDAGHIKNALLIPVSQLAGRINEIEKYKDKSILIYCRSGNRSTVAGEILIEKGFREIYNLRTGIIGWQRDGYETEK